jgi:2-polyprenyl-3-methyl-5-hydroxy-6-metoxy-1,4-benzoquinol methylase
VPATTPGLAVDWRATMRWQDELPEGTGFAGAVLDAGCGTGENALHVASLGLSVLGVDVAEAALAIARAKADDRGIELEFAAADAFQQECLGRR